MKKFLTWFSLVVVLFASLSAATNMAGFTRTYNPDNGTAVYDLYKDPTNYSEDTLYDGAADAIVQQNLDKSRAANDVTSIVFDFRGYDTMGEAFILMVAVAGATVILAGHEKLEKIEKVEKLIKEEKTDEKP